MTKQLVVLMVSAVLAAPALADEEAAAPADKREAGSYAFGYDMGRAFRERGVAVDLAQLLEGFEEGFAGRSPPMSEKDLQKALAAFQGELRVKQEKQRRRLAVENRATGAALLAENKGRPGVVTTASGLQYEIVRAGTGARPTTKDTVLVNYTGTLPDGAVFDSSKGRAEPAALAVASVIPGWQEALQLMPAGSRWRLFIPPELGYGERGGGKAIGPNATLIFDLELVAVR